MKRMKRVTCDHVKAFGHPNILPEKPSNKVEI